MKGITKKIRRANNPYNTKEEKIFHVYKLDVPVIDYEGFMRNNFF